MLGCTVFAGAFRDAVCTSTNFAGVVNGLEIATAAAGSAAFAVGAIGLPDHRERTDRSFSDSIGGRVDAATVWGRRPGNRGGAEQHQRDRTNRDHGCHVTSAEQYRGWGKQILTAAPECWRCSWLFDLASDALERIAVGDDSRQLERLRISGQRFVRGGRGVVCLCFGGGARHDKDGWALAWPCLLLTRSSTTACKVVTVVRSPDERRNLSGGFEICSTSSSG